MKDMGPAISVRKGRKVAEAQAQKRAEAEKLAAPAETPPTPTGDPRTVAQPKP